MVVERATGDIRHRIFADLPEFLRPGDVVVANDTRVIPARLLCRKPTGGWVEVLLLRPAADEALTWEALVRPGRRVRTGSVLEVTEAVTLEVLDRGVGGVRTVRLHAPLPMADVLRTYGEVPLPPYVHETPGDPEEYQTVFASRPGAVAAPTAGLHFTPGMIDRITSMGVAFVAITMHIGLGTFRPVTSEHISAHQMDAEWFDITPEAAETLTRARARGGRIVVVGTSTVRTLETRAGSAGEIGPGSAWSSLFIYPGFRFAVTDVLVTNFHLPRTTLLMLVSAFAGRELVLRAYREAMAERYRFYSFGDAMLIL